MRRLGKIPMCRSPPGRVGFRGDDSQRLFLVLQHDLAEMAAAFHQAVRLGGLT